MTEKTPVEICQCVEPIREWHTRNTCQCGRYFDFDAARRAAQRNTQQLDPDNART